VGALLYSEISNGLYVIVSVKRDICSPLAAIDKSKDSIRLIHDVGRPEIFRPNTVLIINVRVHVQSAKDAFYIIILSSYSWNIDFQIVYRSITMQSLQYFSGSLRPLNGDWKKRLSISGKSA